MKNGKIIRPERLAFEENGFRAVDKGDRVVLYRNNAVVITALYKPGNTQTFILALCRVKGYCEGWAAKEQNVQTDTQSVVSMLLLCGEAGGIAKDEEPHLYLRRILDDYISLQTRSGPDGS